MNIEETFNKKIIESLNLWKFEDACKYHEELLQHSFKHLSEYIKLLADFGKLDKIYDLFSKYGFTYISKLKNEPEQKHPNIFDFSLKLIKEEYIPSKLALCGSDKNSILLHLSLKYDKKDLLTYIDANSSAIINNLSDAKDNMILNYAINSLVSDKLLKSDIGIKIATVFTANPNINDWRKRYVISSILRYFNYQGEHCFFKLKNQYYNHLQNIASQLTKFFNEDGAKIEYKNLNNAILNFNNTSLKSINKKEPKVAVCISGMFRGHESAIQSIKDNVISPLNADVFIHSWNVWQPWVGIGNGGADSWAWRLLGGNGKKYCPVSLKSFLNFKQYFPTSAKIIETPITESFTPDIMSSFIEPTSFRLDNELDFIASLGKNVDAFSARGLHNQAKMFYGIYESTQLMLSHEKKYGFEYDYVIRVRPDCAIIDKFPQDFLSKLNFNELALDMDHGYGPTDQFYISRRDVHIKMANLWKESLGSEKLSPFENFPKYDAHALMFLWMVMNNIIPVTPPVRRNLSIATSSLQPPQDLYDAIAFDLQNSANTLQNMDDVKIFISYLLGLTK